MLGTTAHLDPTAVIVALITLAGVVISSGVAVYGLIVGRANARFLTNHVGETNGAGNLATMAAETVERQKDHEHDDEARFGALLDHAGIDDPVKHA